jgi:hypothetical protein
MASYRKKESGHAPVDVNHRQPAAKRVANTLQRRQITANEMIDLAPHARRPHGRGVKLQLLTMRNNAVVTPRRQPQSLRKSPLTKQFSVYVSLILRSLSKRLESVYNETTDRTLIIGGI